EPRYFFWREAPTMAAFHLPALPPPAAGPAAQALQALLDPYALPEDCRSLALARDLRLPAARRPGRPRPGRPARARTFREARGGGADPGRRADQRPAAGAPEGGQRAAGRQPGTGRGHPRPLPLGKQLLSLPGGHGPADLAAEAGAGRQGLDPPCRR